MQIKCNLLATLIITTAMLIIIKKLYVKIKAKCLPPERIELSTPGLRDQCSTTELKRLYDTVGYVTKITKINLSTVDAS